MYSIHSFYHQQYCASMLWTFFTLRKTDLAVRACWIDMNMHIILNTISLLAKGHHGISVFFLWVEMVRIYSISYIDKDRMNYDGWYKCIQQILYIITFSHIPLITQLFFNTNEGVFLESKCIDLYLSRCSI